MTEQVKSKVSYVAVYRLRDSALMFSEIRILRVSPTFRNNKWIKIKSDVLFFWCGVQDAKTENDDQGMSFRVLAVTEFLLVAFQGSVTCTWTTR